MVEVFVKVVALLKHTVSAVNAATGLGYTITDAMLLVSAGQTPFCTITLYPVVSVKFK